MKDFLRLTILLFLLINGLAVSAQAPLSIPDPNKGNPDNFISDPMGLLSDNTEAKINSQLLKVRKQTGCEVAVAIVKDLKGLSVEDYAYQLFRHWGVGDKDKDNGVLLLVAPEERKARIEVGSGAEGVLTDIACARILRYDLRPAVHDGNLNQGVFNAVNSISEALTDSVAAKELRSSREESTVDRIKTLDGSILTSFLILLAACMFMFTLCLFIVDFIATRNRDNYRRAMTWRSHLSTYWWGAALSFGTALPISIIAYLLYRRARNVKEICDTCGAKMNKLSEDEDNFYLTPSQDFEEKIGTVDYDVWLCPECGTLERLPFVEKQLKYQECPSCHTIAMNLVMEKVVEPPTTKKEGRGERLYQCQFCRHTKRENFRIPKKVDNSAVIAGAAMGAMASGGRGNSGFGGGGGFGGGSSSGGGASMGW